MTLSERASRPNYPSLFGHRIHPRSDESKKEVPEEVHTDDTVVKILKLLCHGKLE